MEPGRDGVGDYTRDLAAACVQRGHACAIVAINDRFVDRSREERQGPKGADLEVLRLPPSDGWRERSQAVLEWLQRKPADCVSLQFVPYGYHPKGVVTTLGAHLAPLVAGRRVHFMLHELWLGVERAASIKHRLVGWAQRHALLKLAKALSPNVVHTSNAAYRAIAVAEGMPARLLPLCGNIPIAANVPARWLDVQAATLGARLVPREQSWWFGLFGTLHPVWSPEPVFGYIAEAAERAGRHVFIGAIGRLGHGETLWRELQAKYAQRFSFVEFGERGARDVSAFLQSVDFGIATTPWELIGKSGTAAAMLEHGLPTIVTRDDVRFRFFSESRFDRLLCKMDPNLPQWLIDGPRRQPARSRQPEMVDTFLADLEAADEPTARQSPRRAAAVS
jgi:hypothetical protein